jgi:hypothetical protein
MLGNTAAENAPRSQAMRWPHNISMSNDAGGPDKRDDRESAPQVPDGR